MTETKLSQKRSRSISSLRKATNSQYWSELSKTSKIMEERVAIFVKQTNIQIVHPNQSVETHTSISTIITTKGKIVID